MGSVRQDVLDRNLARASTRSSASRRGCTRSTCRAGAARTLYRRDLRQPPSPRHRRGRCLEGRHLHRHGGRAAAAGIDGVVICVDTWLGSSEHWLEPSFYPYLAPSMGGPACKPSSPTTSSTTIWALRRAAAAGLGERRRRAGGDEHPPGRHPPRWRARPAQRDGRPGEWWPLLAEGGPADRRRLPPDTHWQGVRQAFDAFMAPRGLMPLENTGRQMPAGQAVQRRLAPTRTGLDSLNRHRERSVAIQSVPPTSAE